MHRTRIVFWSTLCAGVLCAHPMGNFSVNHYARIQQNVGGAEISYVLDLGEIPTHELFKKWDLPAASPQPTLEDRAVKEARDWVRNLHVTIAGRTAEPRFVSARMTLSEGAGGMKVMRVDVKAFVSGGPGKLDYEDHNYPEKAGWKEIVIGAGPDKSQSLTAYPTDPNVSRPQDLRASVDASGVATIGTPETAHESLPSPQPATPETLPAGDYLSTVLHGGEITFGVGLLCMAVAFGLGAMHAFEPGHGKTMVAAYLVGSRGTPKHAVLLGLMTTFTHTVSVFLLGFVTLFLSRYIMPEKMTKVLGVISGLSIVWIGGLMLYRRSRKLLQHSHSHDHAHHHHDHDDHDHEHVHSHHTHSHAHGHSHSHGHAHSHGHSHDHHHDHDHEHPHHHVPEGDITMGSLMALGASGGMVPCPTALILLLTCISLGRTAFGMMLLLSFSVGLAIILMATGLVVIYAKHLVPERHRHAESGLMRTLPVISAAVIVVIGVVMTGVSLGWLPAMRFFG